MSPAMPSCSKKSGQAAASLSTSNPSLGSRNFMVHCYICASIHPSPFAHPSIHLHLHLILSSTSIYLHLFLSIPIYLYSFPSTSIDIYLSLSMSAYLYDCVSLSMSTHLYLPSIYPCLKTYIYILYIYIYTQYCCLIFMLFLVVAWFIIHIGLGRITHVIFGR